MRSDDWLVKADPNERLILASYGLGVQVLCQRGRSPFPVERRPNSLVCASFNPSTSEQREGRSIWLKAPWGHDVQVLGRSPAGHLERCRGESTDQTHSVVVTDEKPTHGWKLLEQGPESQSASLICSGGVSAVMGSSDLDEHTLVSDQADGNQLSCSLPFGAGRPIVGTACKPQMG